MVLSHRVQMYPGVYVSMKLLLKSISALICVIAFFCCLSAGIFMSAQRIVEKENFGKITEQYILSGVKRSVPDRHSSSSEKDGFPPFDDPLKGGTKPDGDVSPTGTLLPPEGSEDIFSGILPEEYSEFLTSLTTGNTDDGSMAKINDLFSNSDALQMLGNIGGISDLSLSSEAGSRLFGEMGGLFDGCSLLQHIWVDVFRNITKYCSAIFSYE